MTTPKIPRGWRRLRTGSRVKPDDKLWAKDHWIIPHCWFSPMFPVHKSEIIIRRKARKTK